MSKRRSMLAVLATALAALPAEAEPVCNVTIYVWELQLEQVAAEAGQPELYSVASELGTKANLRGGFRDPGNPDEPVRVELIGSTDGVGLRANFESVP